MGLNERLGEFARSKRSSSSDFRFRCHLVSSVVGPSGTVRGIDPMCLEDSRTCPSGPGQKTHEITMVRDRASPTRLPGFGQDLSRRMGRTWLIRPVVRRAASPPSCPEFVPVRDLHDRKQPGLCGFDQNEPNRLESTSCDGNDAGPSTCKKRLFNNPILSAETSVSPWLTEVFSCAKVAGSAASDCTEAHCFASENAKQNAKTELAVWSLSRRGRDSFGLTARPVVPRAGISALKSSKRALSGPSLLFARSAGTRVGKQRSHNNRLPDSA